MGIENAILELAAAIRHLADSNREIAASSAPIGYANDDDYMLTAAALRDKKAADLKSDVEKVEADAKPNAARAVIEQKLAEARAAKGNAGSVAGTATAAADTQTTAGAAGTATDEAQTSYDYAKDVAPVLTKVAQKSRDELVKLLAFYGAKKGNELKAEDYWAVLADANKLLAG